ncbi:dynactin subunit 6-like isoform X2 [Paramacrobiotus metropolitanus]|uniref:dynactin subunit 6-like isoform X2 n=1 Tax=Paramacrobiotus metropolitanus TaxID=2943436 RepID=UPI002445DD18|nr:dynactin subunit 6-like isoform X2 [Paramacrobiotus metropolitanus]
MAARAPTGRAGAVTGEDASKNLTAPIGVLILPKAIVPKETELKGEITIGQGTVLHPSCKIIAENGPIVIGEGNIIEEKAIIRNRFPVGEDGTRKTLYIGSRNLLEAYSVVEGSVGNNNSILCKARIGPLTTISTGCVIGVMCSINSDETLAPDTIIIVHRRSCGVPPKATAYISLHSEIIRVNFLSMSFLCK